MARYVRCTVGLLAFSLLAVVFGVLVVPAVLVAFFGVIVQGFGEWITKCVAYLLDACITVFDYTKKLVDIEGDDC